MTVTAILQRKHGFKLSALHAYFVLCTGADAYILNPIIFAKICDKTAGPLNAGESGPLCNTKPEQPIATPLNIIVVVIRKFFKVPISKSAYYPGV